MVRLYLLTMVGLFACSPELSELRPSFAPEASLQAYTEAAVTRYVAATGRTDIAIDQDQGVPVLYGEDLTKVGEDGKEIQLCGMTSWETVGGRFTDAVIYIDPTPPDGCPPAHVVELHEFIHAMAPDTNHTDRGLFALTNDGTSQIDSTSLSELCSRFDCELFNPETP